MRIYAAGLLGSLALVIFIVGTIVATNGIKIAVKPDDAVPTAQTRVELGLAVAIDNVVYGFPGSYRLRVGAEGFFDELVSVTPEDRASTLLVTLKEKPGRLAFSTSPSDENTRWEIHAETGGESDSVLATVSDQLEAELPPGDYRLTIVNPFFEVMEDRLTIERDTAYTRVFLLQPVAGELRIASRPGGASVSIDGEAAAETPATITLEGGEYEVVVEKDGYAPVTETIRLTHDTARADRDYRLERLAAYLTVSVRPAGGQLLLNGLQVTPGERLTLASNEPQSLSYYKGGYRTYREDFVPKAGEERSLDIRLDAEFGKVRVESRPEATVRLDGKEVGTTPLDLSLIARPHRIELIKPGFRTVRKTVKPSATSPMYIKETLLPELQARLKEAPARYVNSVGIELKLFKPDSFRMGAPRHEKGQRANEFERDVTLTKAFYAGLHEVTVEQFQKFARGAIGRSGYPVRMIAWIEAAAFCNWLSREEGLKPFYEIAGGRLTGVNRTADGYRMLSEAEWEWLARKAGKKRQTVFYWGDDTMVPEQAGNISDEYARGMVDVYVPNYSDGYAGVAPVGSFPPEASGLYDLAGNVSEWVHDSYSLVPPKKGDVHIDPLGPPLGSVRVVKGANWRSGTRTSLRPAFRDGIEGPREDTGFRIGRYLYGKETQQAAN